MMGINVLCKGLHLGECQRLPLLTHNVFDAFSESGIVAVLEDTFIPAGADSKTVEFDVILYNMLIIVHFEVINSVFSIGGGVYGTKLSAESLDKIGPIIKPVRNFIGVKEGWLKEFQGGPSEIGKHEGRSKVDAIRNQHPYVINYVSAKRGKIFNSRGKKFLEGV